MPSDQDAGEWISKNPAISAFYGFDSTCSTSFLLCFSGQGGFARIDPTELRRIQNSEAAQRAVVKGVQRMKDKQSLGALQAFNEALGYDDSCCDAYVARAAALANDGKYEPAVSDLEKALNINSEHQNARRYIVATLLAWANSLKENGDMKGARDKFARVLTYEEDATAQKAIEELDVKSHAVKRRVTASKGTLQGQNGKSCQAKRLRVENAAKLKEMEEFIARLKK